MSQIIAIDIIDPLKICIQPSQVAYSQTTTERKYRKQSHTLIDADLREKSPTAVMLEKGCNKQSMEEYNVMKYTTVGATDSQARSFPLLHVDSGFPL